MYINHVISTKSELLTSGFRPPERPTHSGCDYIDSQRREITPRGVDIISIADGEIARISKDSTSGNFIYIRHNVNTESFYCHLRDNSICVKVGDKIKKEQVIAVMGKTGNIISSRYDIPEEYRGSHLHLGVRVNGIWVNPEPYLTGEKTIANAKENAGNAATGKNFISDIIAPLAVADMKKNKILASITIAQACIETGYGKSALMMKNNAPFGVKATETWLKSGGRAYNANTGEHINGQNVTISAAFRAYNNLTDAVEDHANVLKLPYYNKSKGGKVPYDIVGETDYVKAAECLLPYATGPTYVQSVKAVIETYNLTQYDTGMAVATIPEPSNPPVIVSPPTQSVITFNVGNKVKILSDAVMYAGTTTKIPEKYKNKSYTIQQVKPDKILIEELYSWVLSKDLMKVA